MGRGEGGGGPGGAPPALMDACHLFDGDCSAAADAVGPSLQALLVLVRLAGLPGLWSREEPR